jgi:hypothetical protein
MIFEHLIYLLIQAKIDNNYGFEILFSVLDRKYLFDFELMLSFYHSKNYVFLKIDQLIKNFVIYLLNLKKTLTVRNFYKI